MLPACTLWIARRKSSRDLPVFHHPHQKYIRMSMHACAHAVVEEGWSNCGVEEGRGGWSHVGVEEGWVVEEGRGGMVSLCGTVEPTG